MPSEDSRYDQPTYLRIWEPVASSELCLGKIDLPTWTSKEDCCSVGDRVYNAVGHSTLNLKGKLF